MGEITFQVIRIFSLAAIAFIIAIAVTPLWTKFLYRFKLGKKIRTEAAFKSLRTSKETVFAKLHKKKEGTPTMGGVIIWGTVLIVLILLAIGRFIFPGSLFEDFYFLSRAQTILPLAFLMFGAMIGLFDDVLGIIRIGPKGGGLQMRYRFLLYIAMAVVGAWWFFFKLQWDVLSIPFAGTFSIGAWYIPIFILIVTATVHSVNLTDGLDGLAGGTLLIAFASYGLIAFVLGRYDLAVLCGVIVGALVAFLWFNIHPARFFMGDTGSMSLGVTLGVIAMLTNAVLVLPLIAFIPLVETGSVIVQLTSKKIRKKKIFISTPIHHHFEAKGWPETKVTERFWIISGVMAIIGLIIWLLG